MLRTAQTFLPTCRTGQHASFAPCLFPFEAVGVSVCVIYSWFSDKGRAAPAQQTAISCMQPLSSCGYAALWLPHEAAGVDLETNGVDTIGAFLSRAQRAALQPLTCFVVSIGRSWNADESGNIHVASGIRSCALRVRAHIAHRPRNYIGGGWCWCSCGPYNWCSNACQPQQWHSGPTVSSHHSCVCVHTRVRACEVAASSSVSPQAAFSVCVLALASPLEFRLYFFFCSPCWQYGTDRWRLLRFSKAAVSRAAGGRLRGHQSELVWKAADKLFHSFI